MKKAMFFKLLVLTVGILQAQESSNLVSQGDVFVLGSPTGSSYEHLDFPKKNIIVKRGAIANFTGLIGKKLIVENVIANEDGFTKVALRRKDGLKFFRFYPTVTANLPDALTKGELKALPNE